MSAEINSKLSVQNMGRNRSSMRHDYQDTIEDQDWWEPEVQEPRERHQFLRRCDVMNVIPSDTDSVPTGRTRIGVDSLILRQVFPSHVAGNIDSSARVYRIHGEAGFITN